jgi:hypothetical protein
MPRCVDLEQPSHYCGIYRIGLDWRARADSSKSTNPDHAWTPKGILDREASEEPAAGRPELAVAVATAEALHGAGRDFTLGLEPVQDQFLMRAPHASDFLHRRSESKRPQSQRSKTDLTFGPRPIQPTAKSRETALFKASLQFDLKPVDSQACSFR